MSLTARLMRTLSIALLLVCCLCHSGSATAADGAAALRKQYEALTPQLNNSPFQRMLHLDSVESTSTLKGDIYAVMDYPFTGINSELADPEKGAANWCDVLILHPNIKYCHAPSGGKGKSISMNIGNKGEQSLTDAYRLDFNYRVAAAGPEYFRIDLNADSGPLGTRDYHIVLEALAIDSKHTFLHFTYSYSYGMAERMAMNAYLSTLGRNKVGFTHTGRQSNGQPDYIDGVRGLVERNTMRYYLAIDAYLSALSLPAEKRLEKRLSNWFGVSEQYARQLHEMERQEYMQMKYHEYRRQQTER